MLADGFSSWYPFLNAFICGPVIVLLLAFLEFIVFAGNFRKKKFLVVLSIKIGTYFLSILFCILSVFVITRMLKYDISIPQAIRSEEFQNYLWYGDFKVLMAYVFGLVILTNFILQMNRKMGQGVLLGFLTGKFRVPQEEYGFVMFLKLHESEKFIQTLGNLKFLQFFNEVIFDITDSMVFRKGIISSYIDDEILITWNTEHGAQDANAIRTYFEIKEKIDLNKVNYFERYGAVPRFTCSLHHGSIVCGEIGGVKSEVRYHGDAVNTAHRMLNIATFEHSFIVSEYILQLMVLPELYTSRVIGPVDIRGKKNPLLLHAIRELQ